MIPVPTLIYHITHIDNLPSILSNGGLLCTNALQIQSHSIVDIAYENIQSRRSERIVPLSPHGNLHDYVPFYFSYRSPMLYTIDRGNVPHYQQGQKEIIYLVSSVQRAIADNIPFVFTDGHAVMHYSEFYNDPQHLDQIDWSVMGSSMWNDTTEHPDRKRRRQAEFLAFERFPIRSLLGIGTFDKLHQERVSAYLGPISLYVTVRRNWYY